MAKTTIITEEQIMDTLDKVYEKVLNGIPNISPSLEEFADDYWRESDTKRRAARDLIRAQIAKCTTSGFITGFGGVLTLPITIPANVGSVLYVQMRMIAGTAYLGGYDVDNGAVQTLIYACLAGVSVDKYLEIAGINPIEKNVASRIDMLSGEALTEINHKVGARLVNKLGETGLLKLGKLIPGIGAVVNGAVDYSDTKVIGNRAYNMFILGDYKNADA